MFVSLKESRIENNRCFYSSFYLGPFPAGQSLTIANALRRTLLSECFGLAITSVKIDNVTHEYSTLEGVKDSVLDILLNLKEIVLKKRGFKTNRNSEKSQSPLELKATGPLGKSFAGKRVPTITHSPKINPPHQAVVHSLHSSLPVTGYLKKRGPGVVRAKDLHLPPFIQCVDPSQYIATLAEDGVLNIEFVVMEGKGYATQKSQMMADSSASQRSRSLESLSWTNRTSRDSEENQKITTVKTDSLKNKKRLEREELLTQLKAILKKSTTEMQNNALPAENRNEEKVQGASKGLDLNTNKGRTKRLNELENDVVSSLTRAEASTALTSDMSSKTKMGVDQMKLTRVLKQLKSGLTLNPTHKEHDGHYLSETKSKIEKREMGKAKATISAGDSPEGVTTHFSSSFNSFLNETKKEIYLDSVFSPILKVNYIVEDTNNYIVDKNTDSYSFLKNLSQLLDSSIALDNIEKMKNIKNLKEPYTEDLLNYVSSLSQTELQYLTTSLQTTASYQNKKSGVALEIWTNGSIHPKDALLFALKNLSNTFSTLQKGCIFSPIFNQIQTYNL